MASYLAFAGSETFAPRSQITFGSLDFLTQKTDELHLVNHNVANIIGPVPRHSTLTKVAKQRLKRCVVSLKRRLNASAAAVKLRVKAFPPSAMVPVIGRQPASILDLLEDDLRSASTEPSLDSDEAQERACFVATPPRGDNEGGDLGSPIQEEEYQRQR
jgi:hypothetical protein